jgi:hypothetical protein
MERQFNLEIFILTRNSGIDSLSDKVECRPVNGLDESFASLSGFLNSEGCVNRVASGNDGSRSEGQRETV